MRGERERTRLLMRLYINTRVVSERLLDRRAGGPSRWSCPVPPVRVVCVHGEIPPYMVVCSWEYLSTA